MSDDKMNELVYILLSDFEILLKKTYGINYHVEIKNKISLCTTDFVLSFYENDKHFYVSFKLGLTGKDIANYTKVMLQIFCPEEFTVIEDCYYNKDEKCMVYGQEAIDLKQKTILNNSGYIKCPVCEKVFKKDQIHENGICKFCDMTSIVWN